MVKAVILASGEGKRFRPFSLTRPKPLTPVLNKPFLYYLLDEIEKFVDKKDIIIVGNNNVRELVGGYKVIDQTFYYGTGAAAYSAMDYAGKDEVLLVNGDVYTDSETIKKLINNENAIVGYRVEDATKYGVFKIENGYIKEWVEKSKNPPSNIANAGIYKFSSNFWSYVEYIIKNNIISERGEYELTDAINNMLKDGIKIRLIETNVWLHLSYPRDLFKIEKYFLNREYNNILANIKDSNFSNINGILVDDESKIGKFVKLKGTGIITNSVIGNDSIIWGEVYINNSNIKQFSMIEGQASLHNRIILINFARVRNSIIMEGTKILAYSHIEDAIIGEQVYMGSNVKVSNKKLNGSDIVSMYENTIQNEKSGFGVLIGSRSEVGDNSNILFGSVIYPDIKIAPNSLVSGVIN